MRVGRRRYDVAKGEKMTEREWLNGSDSGPFLNYVQANASDRRVRLLAAACCRALSDLLDPYDRRAIRAAERYADGEFSQEKLNFAWKSVRWSAQSRRRRREGSTARDFAYLALRMALDENPRQFLYDSPQAEIHWALGYAPHCQPPVELPLDEIALIRDIFGNPFRPVAFDPAWRTPSAVALAQAIYAERRFADLPILADALEEAGCTSVAILDHCRNGGEHVRGCWAVDLVLDRN